MLATLRSIAESVSQQANLDTALVCFVQMVKDAMNMLERRLDGQCTSIEEVQMVDLDLPDHLSGKHGHFIKLSFSNVQDLYNVRKQILPLVQKNQTRHKNKNTSRAISTGSGYGKTI